MLVVKIDILLSEINELFVRNGYESEILNNKIEMKLKIEDEFVNIKINIPNDYPYTFLEVYLEDRNQLSFKIPHMIVENRLCLFDEGSDRHDYKEYLKIALETIERVKELLGKSKNEKYSDEFHNEFLDLWGNGNENIKLYSLLNSYDHPKVLNTYYFEKKNSKEKNELHFIVKDSTIDASSVLWLSKNLSLDYKKKRFKSMYFPIETAILTKPIRTVKELTDILKKEKFYDDFLRLLKTVLSSNDPIFIILGIKNENLSIRSLIGIRLPDLVEPKGKIQKHRSYAGVLMFNSSQKITRYKVNDLSSNRLFTRGGEGVKTNKKNSAYLVGCGSLGGYLAKSLSDTGYFSKFILHDNQALKSENIGRHLCGVDCIGTSKSLVVANRISSYNPTLNTQVYTHSFYQELLGKENNILREEYDVLFIATGDENIEEEVIRLLEKKILKKPTIIAWVEPFLLVGHAFFLNSEINNQTKQYLFDSEGNIRIGIVENPIQFSKSEAGCQSYFMPYSGLEMQLFTQSLVDNLFTKSLIKEKGNFHFTWFGKVKNARQKGIKMSPQWRAVDDRQIYINRIDE